MNCGKLLTTAAMVLCMALSGCGAMSDVNRFFIGDAHIFDRYELTKLKQSTSSDVLSIIQDSKTELLTQSESIVASWGEKKKGSVLWFNMVAFHEEDLTAARKYSFVANERAKGYFVKPMQRLRFDAELILNLEILEEPYADRNAMRIAILREVLARFSEDAGELTFDSRTLLSGSMMVKRVLNIVLTKLEQSPALAIHLPEMGGLDFDHMNFGPGRIRMLIEDDIVKVKAKVGKDWFNMQLFGTHPDVVNM